MACWSVRVKLAYNMLRTIYTNRILNITVAFALPARRVGLVLLWISTFARLILVAEIEGKNGYSFSIK